MRVRASRSVDQVAAPDGRTLTLISRTWHAGVGKGPIGVAWTYRHPNRIELSAPAGDVHRVRMIDHVMVVRAAAAVLMLVASLTLRRHR